ncbi:amidohydrolase family protein [Bradyrhizobium sp. LHD-71]|uniref:amidohydrolase family protein n=1 Tax=Bradyrhizobium sp. LHD-71 TaxID=3072141 RepID=UPI00280D40A3|nr:amidohydrolase family protein [Bradyrhizobium sp. LHD-71]MDQ8727409.1 amidohydrolase family protein [Bradyrhizobium sp. LHD-71]
MPAPLPGAIDCDLHIAVPQTRTLVPFLDEYWADHVRIRGVESQSYQMSSLPPRAPLSVRPDWQASDGALPGSHFGDLKSKVLDQFKLKFAVCNCIHGTQIMLSEDMSLAFCKATNDWLAKEWLDRDPRLRASIVVPAESPELAAEEIERVAIDRRFVQILMLAMGERPLGRRSYWPIYRAAEFHKLPIGIHAGSNYRHPPSSIGWPSYYLEDYVAQAQAFAAQLLSLVTEGVFVKFPELKIVMMESGVTWLPGTIWRADKTWRAVRFEVPWLHQAPGEVIRDHVRFTIQPFDAPSRREQLERLLEQLGSEDILLFSTDYPHWHFDGDDAVPDGLPDALVRKMLFDNPLMTYPRLSHTARDSLE